MRHRVTSGVKLSFDPGDCRPDLIVDTDPRRVEQILFNLLQNATKFTSEGYITLSTLSIDADRSILSMTVTDTGTGVPRGMEDRIFERYEKGHPSAEGWGLGLSISRQIARLLGGDVVLDRSYNGGARFIFTLPSPDTHRTKDPAPQTVCDTGSCLCGHHPVDGYWRQLILLGLAVAAKHIDDLVLVELLHLVASR